MLIMTQVSSEIKLPDYSFLRRFLGLLLSALAIVAGLTVVLVALIILLLLVFPMALMGLMMMFAYSLDGITEIAALVFISILLASLVATAFGRDSNFLRASSVIAYFGIGILSSVILYVILGYDSPLIVAVAIIAITVVGPVIYVNNFPSAKQERALAATKHRKELLNTVPTESFHTFDEWLRKQKFPEGDLRNNPKNWAISAYGDAILYTAPKGTSKEVLMTRKGKAVKFKDNGNRDNEYTTSYEALWEENS